MYFIWTFKNVTNFLKQKTHIEKLNLAGIPLNLSYKENHVVS